MTTTLSRACLCLALAAGLVGCDDDPDVDDAGAVADAALDFTPPDVLFSDLTLPDVTPTDGRVADGGGDGAVDDRGVEPDDGRPLDHGADLGPLADDGPPDQSPPDQSPPDQSPPDEGPDIGQIERCGHPRSTCRADADCPGGRCGELPDDPAAPCVCIGPAPEARRAFCGGGEPGACCEDSDCAGGEVCQQEVYGAQNEYCGGAPPPDINACRGDACSADADCAADQVCVPAGALGFVYSRCARALCRVDADCDARPGGECRAYFTPCRSAAFGCSYADDPCRTDADCPPGMFGERTCVPRLDGSGTVCEDYLPPP